MAKRRIYLKRHVICKSKNFLRKFDNKKNIIMYSCLNGYKEFSCVFFFARQIHFVHQVPNRVMMAFVFLKKVYWS